MYKNQSPGKILRPSAVLQIHHNSVVSSQPFCIEGTGSILISHSTQAMYQQEIIIVDTQTPADTDV
jgi:hypothetical protein